MRCPLSARRHQQHLELTGFGPVLTRVEHVIGVASTVTSTSSSLGSRLFSHIVAEILRLDVHPIGSHRSHCSSHMCATPCGLAAATISSHNNAKKSFFFVERFFHLDGTRYRSQRLQQSFGMCMQSTIREHLATCYLIPLRPADHKVFTTYRTWIVRR